MVGSGFALVVCVQLVTMIVGLGWLLTWTVKVVEFVKRLGWVVGKNPGQRMGKLDWVGMGWVGAAAEMATRPNWCGTQGCIVVVAAGVVPGDLVVDPILLLHVALGQFGFVVVCGMVDDDADYVSGLSYYSSIAGGTWEWR